MGGGVLAAALGEGFTGGGGSFAADLDLGRSGLPGGGAGVRVGRCERVRDGGALGAFLR